MQLLILFLVLLVLVLGVLAALAFYKLYYIESINRISNKIYIANSERKYLTELAARSEKIIYLEAQAIDLRKAIDEVRDEKSNIEDMFLKFITQIKGG